MAKVRAAQERHKSEHKPLRSDVRVIQRRCRLWLTILAVHTSCTVFRRIKLQGRVIKVMRMSKADNHTLLRVLFTQWKLEFRIRRESHKDRRMRRVLLPLIVNMRIHKKRRKIELIKEFVDDCVKREKLVVHLKKLKRHVTTVQRWWWRSPNAFCNFAIVTQCYEACLAIGK